MVKQTVGEWGYFKKRKKNMKKVTSGHPVSEGTKNKPIFTEERK